MDGSRGEMRLMLDSEAIGIISIAVVGGGIIASLLLHFSRESRINREHKRINDERMANGLPPLSRKELGLDEEFDLNAKKEKGKDE